MSKSEQKLSPQEWQARYVRLAGFVMPRGGGASVHAGDIIELNPGLLDHPPSRVMTPNEVICIVPVPKTSQEQKCHG